MSLYAIFETLNVGGVVALIVVLMTIVQIVPCKIDPWTWLGDQLNKNIKTDMNNRIDDVEKSINEMQTEIESTSHKLDEHIATSYRTKIIGFQDDILEKNMLKTQAQWKEINRACAEYEEYIENNHLINGDATEAIEFIHQEYQRCCEYRTFRDSPVIKSDKK